jgi:hypothetical protein
MSNYDHLRTPPAYDDMIRPLLEALEAVEANLRHASGEEHMFLTWCRNDINNALVDLENAHRWDGDEPRT